MAGVKLNLETNLYPPSFKGFLNKNEEKTESLKFHIPPKTLAIASAAALAIGSAALLIAKNKDISNAKTFFDKTISETQGNNKFLSSVISAEEEGVQKFINDYPEGYEKIKQTILGMVEIKDSAEVLDGGMLYHGTSLDSAKKIFTEGVTPFSDKRTGSASGIGHGFYTTPTREAAEIYSRQGYLGGIVLPFDFQGKIGVLKPEFQAEGKGIKETVVGQMAFIIDPPKEKTGLAAMFHFPNEIARKYAQMHCAQMVSHAMADLGIDAVKTEGAVTKGFLSGILGKSPEILDTAGQVVVYNGEKICLSVEKLKELNPINSNNYKKFLQAMGN